MTSWYLLHTKEKEQSLALSFIWEYSTPRCQYYCSSLKWGIKKEYIRPAHGLVVKRSWIPQGWTMVQDLVPVQTQWETHQHMYTHVPNSKRTERWRRTCKRVPVPLEVLSLLLPSFPLWWVPKTSGKLFLPKKSNIKNTNGKKKMKSIFSRKIMAFFFFFHDREREQEAPSTGSCHAAISFPQSSSSLGYWVPAMSSDQPRNPNLWLPCKFQPYRALLPLLRHGGWGQWRRILK